MRDYSERTESFGEHEGQEQSETGDTTTVIDDYDTDTAVEYSPDLELSETPGSIDLEGNDMKGKDPDISRDVEPEERSEDESEEREPVQSSVENPKSSLSPLISQLEQRDSSHIGVIESNEEVPGGAARGS